MRCEGYASDPPACAQPERTRAAPEPEDMRLVEIVAACLRVPPDTERRSRRRGARAKPRQDLEGDRDSDGFSSSG